MTKEKIACDLPEGLRCKRSDNKNWRCSKRRTNDSSYCEHHRDIIRRNYKNRKNRKNGSADEAKTGINRSQPEVMIGITKQCLSNKYKIMEPEIADTAVLPDHIFNLENLKDVLTMEVWREQLTPTERCDLRSLLPEGHRNNTVVETLLSGHNINFGNPFLKWGSSVCNGDQFPNALLQKERELKLSQVQYFKNLKTYHDTFIDSVEELKHLCESCDHNDKVFRKELMKRMAKRLKVSKDQDVGRREWL